MVITIARLHSTKSKLRLCRGSKPVLLRWSVSGPYLPTFGLNTEIYEVNLRIQSECVKIAVRMLEKTDQKNPNTDSFSQWETIEVLLAISWVIYVAKIDNIWKPFTIVEKSSILIFWDSSNALLEALIFSKDLFWNPSKPGHFLKVFNKGLGYLEIDRKFFGISTSICTTATSIKSKMITQLLQNVLWGNLKNHSEYFIVVWRSRIQSQLAKYCVKYSRIWIFSEPYFPIWRQNLQFCPTTGKYGSKKPLLWHILHSKTCND